MKYFDDSPTYVANRVKICDDCVIVEGSELYQTIQTFDSARALANESYFGKIPLIGFLNDELAKVKEIFKKRITFTLTQANRMEISRNIQKVELLLEKHFNVESVTIEVTEGASIGSIPISMGKLNLEKYQKYEDPMIEYGKVEINATGIHYVHSENKHIIISIGHILFSNQNMRPEYISALLIHATGTSFYQYRHDCTIGTQKLISNLSELQIIVLNVINVIRTIKKNFFNKKTKFSYLRYMFTDKFEKEFPDPMNDPIFHEKILPNARKEAAKIGGGFIETMFIVVTAVKYVVGSWKTIFFNKNKDIRNIEETRSRILAGTFILENEDDLESAVGAIVDQVMTIIDIIFRITIMGPRFVLGLIVSPIFMIGTHWNRSNEYNQAAIASAYGLGPETAEAVVLLGKISHGDAFEKDGMLKVANAVPVLREVIQLPFVTLSIIEKLAGGSISDRKKIKVMYTELQKELNSPDLNPKLQKSIAEELDKIKVLYDSYIEPKNSSETGAHARALIYLIFRIFLKLRPNASKKPDSVHIGMTVVNILRASPDIKAELKINNDEEALLQTSIARSVTEDELLDDLVFNSADVSQGVIPIDYEVSWESRLSDDLYDCINQRITNESYFGEVQVVIDSINIVKEIRKTLPKRGKLDDSQKDTLKKLLVSWGEIISNHFNVETTFISFDSVYNACAYPMIVGDSLEFKSAKENKILETPTGFKFKTKDHMCFVLNIGLPLITDPKLKDETIVGVIFHEIGHSFQQYENESLVRARVTETYASIVTTIIELASNLAALNIFRVIGIILYFPVGLLTGFGLKKSRKIYAQSSKEDSDKNLDSANIKDDGKIKFSNQQSPKYNFSILSALVFIIQALLFNLAKLFPIPGIGGLIMVVVQDPLYILELALKGNYYSKGKKDEYFADAFSAKYGLGQYLAEFQFSMFESVHSGGRIPIIGIFIQLNWMCYVALMHAVDAHPTDRKRIKSMRDRLVNELLNNPDMPEKLKADLKIKIAAIDEIYDKLTNPMENIKNGRVGAAILYALMRTFFKLKSSAKSVAELSAPSVISKKEAISAFVATLREDPLLNRDIGVSLGDVEKIAFSDGELTEDEVMEYNFK